MDLQALSALAADCQLSVRLYSDANARIPNKGAQAGNAVIDIFILHALNVVNGFGGGADMTIAERKTN